MVWKDESIYAGGRWIWDVRILSSCHDHTSISVSVVRTSSVPSHVSVSWVSNLVAKWKGDWEKTHKICDSHSEWSYKGAVAHRSSAPLRDATPCSQLLFRALVTASIKTLSACSILSLQILRTNQTISFWSGGNLQHWRFSGNSLYAHISKCASSTTLLEWPLSEAESGLLDMQF